MKCNMIRVLMLVGWILVGLPVLLILLNVIGLLIWVVGLIVILVAK